MTQSTEIAPRTCVPIAIAFAMLHVLIFTEPVQAQCVLPQQGKLIASDSAANDEFGRSVAISGNTVLVGAYQDNHTGMAGADQGSAYVFVRSGDVWTQQAKLTASDAASGDLFGYSVSLSGDTAVVGAYWDDHAGGTDAGSAYIFVRSGTTWTQQAKLVASDATANAYFGYSASIEGDTVVVGTIFGNAPGVIGAGSAYVFVRSGTTWTQQAKLVASDPAANDYFGRSVSVSNDTVVIGASGVDHVGGVTDVGSAYVFVRTGVVWSQQAKLTASDWAGGDEFGYSVANSGDTTVVGSFRDDLETGVDAGSAYVFIRAGSVWTEQGQLTASDASAGDLFGRSVEVSSDRAVVGAISDNSDAGSAYVFLRTGTVWTQQAKLTASDAAGGDIFGDSVALSGDSAVVGAEWDDNAGGANAGSAYVFKLVCDNDGDGVPNTIDNCPNTSNPGQEDTDADGVGNACDNCLNTSNPGQGDVDADGVGDACDNCLNTPNAGQQDADADGLGNACDVCPNYTPGLPIAPNGRPLRDCNNDCQVNGADVLCIVNEILSQ